MVGDHGNEGGFGNSGWDGVGDPDGGGGGRSKEILFDFFMSAGQTKRILILDSTPFTYWQHSLYEITHNFSDTAVCLKKEQLDERGCPVCSVTVMSKAGKPYTLFPNLVGAVSVIDMGEVVYENGEPFLQAWAAKNGKEYQFVKRRLIAKKGSDDKPGMLRKIMGMANRKCKGDLIGTVWDVTRSGDKTEAIGDQWEFVETVKPEDWKRYLMALGAHDTELDLTKVVWKKQFEPKSYEALERMCSGVKKIEKVAGERPVASGAGRRPLNQAGKTDDDGDTIPF